MKIIKSFKLFESGIPYLDFRNIKIKIDELLSGERFQPHVDQISEWTGKNIKFHVSVTADETKYGIQYQVSFKSDDSIDIKLVNPEIKNSWRDIMEVLMDMSGHRGGIKVTKFFYFGHVSEGKKDGHTLQIEDVTDQLVDAIELDTQLSNREIPISFTFTLV